MAWSIEFPDDAKVLLHADRGWSLRTWPGLKVEATGQGRLTIRGDGRRAVLDDGHVRVDDSTVLAVDHVSSVKWLDRNRLAVTAGEPGEVPPTSRLPRPITGSTAWVMGAWLAGDERVVVVDVDTGTLVTVAEAEGNQSLSSICAAGDGGLTYELARPPIPGLGAGSRRFRYVDEAGRDIDLHPTLEGVTSTVGDGSSSLVAWSDVATFFPEWPRVCRADGTPVIAAADRRQDPALAATDSQTSRIAVPIERGLASDVVVAALDGDSPVARTALEGHVLALGFAPGGALLAIVSRVEGSIDLVDTADSEHALPAPSSPRRRGCQRVAVHIRRPHPRWNPRRPAWAARAVRARR